MLYLQVILQVLYDYDNDDDDDYYYYYYYIISILQLYNNYIIIIIERYLLAVTAVSFQLESKAYHRNVMPQKPTQYDRIEGFNYQSIEDDYRHL